MRFCILINGILGIIFGKCSFQFNGLVLTDYFW